MKVYSVVFVLLACLLFNVSVATAKMESKRSKKRKQEVTFVSNESRNCVDVLINGSLFTAYAWPDDVMKPVLYPILTSKGTEVTRGFPINPRSGERTDHPHHVGLWFNYGDVNGLDFWNNSPAIPEEKRGSYGTIRHKSVERLSAGKGKGTMVTVAEWVDLSGDKLFDEQTEIHFIARGDVRIIDRITTLTASDKDILMKDNKEGAFAIRVARQLEMPSKKPVKLTDSHGNPTDVPVMDNSVVSGNYVSSEGVEGESVWGTRARWMNLHGKFDDEDVALVICDHPDNPGYPTYWHARGYGLFSANTLGHKVFSKGEEELNLTVKAGESVAFRYRVIVMSGSKGDGEKINKLAKEFAERY